MSVPFDQPVTDIIRHRKSWRSYEPRSLTPATLESLESRVAALGRGPFGGRVRVSVREARDVDTRALGAFGTYGMIRGARHYLVGAVERGAMDHEDFGYVFEAAILSATDLGLGTCWLGGTLDRSMFGQMIDVTEREMLPAVSPVGYATARRSWRDHVVRLGARAHRRHPWEQLFFDGSFHRPLNLASAGPWAECLEMLRRAPSGSNQQPWRVVRDPDGEALHLYRQRTRTYRATERLGLLPVDIQRIDIGIAMCHVELTAQGLGLDGAWDPWPESPRISGIPDHTEYIVSWNIK